MSPPARTTTPGYVCITRQANVDNSWKCQCLKNTSFRAPRIAKAIKFRRFAVNLLHDPLRDPYRPGNERFRLWRRSVAEDFVLVLQVPCDENSCRNQERALPTFIHPNMVAIR